MPCIFADDNDGQFAYQAIVGVATPLTWLGVTGLTLTAEYRFFGTLQPEIFTHRPNPATNVPLRPARSRPDNYNHSFMLGLRYALFQPPPAPPPVVPPTAAPAPAQAQTYLVFFDWDRADLTARAREIIGEAAQAPRRVQSTRIEVAGHADRSGSPQYNQRLSQRRADAVAAELVAQRHRAQRDRHQRLRREPPAGADRRWRARAAEPPRRSRSGVIRPTLTFGNCSRP